VTSEREKLKIYGFRKVIEDKAKRLFTPDKPTKAKPWPTWAK
jgi:hypothetical protein